MIRNPITIEALETLDAIDRRGSYAKASEELNKATSAVSYAIQKLEEQLGITLFQRQGRRSVLTPAGQRILQEGRKILMATSQLANSAKEVATGWEPKIRIAMESTLNQPVLYDVLSDFLAEHENVEVDLIECVLNGGWEALEQDRVELLVGAPGPVPLQKGFRAIPLTDTDLIPVIATSHQLAELALDTQRLTEILPKLRRVVTHDTSILEVSRSAGLTDAGKTFYVQTMDQKVEAILAGIGIGHLPRKRIHQAIESGKLKELKLAKVNNHECFMAWKLSNKGKGLQALTQLLATAKW
ncbi:MULTISPECIES: LysR family transcriptional regulator [unclassified Oleiphilus]|jgi:DNA-binding transcriptional LysR family regulator|uniref:LysR family transcriptional regulator n=1 Tax=unclassified Oleiphilus TaxID=2631174 RepID=UPI0007C27299|nr:MULTISPECIES: LysR family transcriptional regulator [unclassified Oleiphilus]KZY38871.1 LysR family transcriptional regulator [Oleiphilus sp. HI0043]KZZ67368.1 LysR family transcriptional regulator [Oleiphilus sp. HI0128]